MNGNFVFLDGLILGFIASLFLVISCYISYETGIDSGKDLCIAHPEKCERPLSLSEVLEGKKK